MKTQIKMTFQDEVALAGITMIATVISGDIVIDLIVGIATYSIARLFYFYFSTDMKALISRVKSILVKKKNIPYWIKKRLNKKK